MKRRGGRWALLLLAALPACSGDDPQAQGAEQELSETQRQFIAMRGEPQLFTVAFVDQQVAADGSVSQLDPPRRAETWAWTGATTRVALFDSGFFVSEGESAGLSSLPQPVLAPDALRAGMTPDEIDALMGASGIEETVVLESAGEVTYWRYHTLASPAAFTFVAGGLRGAVVGFAFDLPGVTP